MPWSSKGNEACGPARSATSATCSVRSRRTSVRLERRPGLDAEARTTAYPGDGYVDIIGLDVYDKGIPVGVELRRRSRGSIPTPRRNWELRTCGSSATSRSRTASRSATPNGVSSGVNEPTSNVGGDNPTFIQGMYDWMSGLPDKRPRKPGVPLVLQRGRRQRRQSRPPHFPKAQQRFRSVFGGARQAPARAPGTGSAPSSGSTPNSGIPPLTTHGPGYSMLGADGKVYPFGSARNVGNGSAPAMAYASRSDGSGYWVVDPAGNVSHFGTAANHGGHPGLRAGEGSARSRRRRSGERLLAVHQSRPGVRVRRRALLRRHGRPKH